MTPQLSRVVTDGVTRMPGIEVSVDTSRCVGRGICANDNVCFVKAVNVADKKARIDGVLCKGCGRCVERCPHQAITLTLNDPHYFEHSLERIEPLVYVKAV
jgi:ferredoxin